MTVVLRNVVAATAALGVIGVVAAPAALAESGDPRVPDREVSVPVAPKTDVVTAHGPLSDLAAGGPFDGARAVVVMVTRDFRSTVQLRVQGIDRGAAGRTFGAHLHVGPCVADDGAAAGPHYNADVIAGRMPPHVDRSTEVWLDFTVTPGGAGAATAVVPFRPQPGDRSIVIHQEPTDHHGAAGARLACVPLSW